LSAPKAGWQEVEGDLCDENFVWSLVRMVKPTLVLNFASQAIVSDSIKAPLFTMCNNVKSTAALLEACRAFCGKEVLFVHQSTDKVYGTGRNINEKAPLVPTCPYSASKIATDALVGSYDATYDMPTITIRSANLYGPGDLNFSRIIPSNIQSMLRDGTVKVYSDAAQRVRQYIYVGDFYHWMNWSIEYWWSNIRKVLKVGGSNPKPERFVFNVLPFAKILSVAQALEDLQATNEQVGAYSADKVIDAIVECAISSSASPYTTLSQFKQINVPSIGLTEIDEQVLTSKYVYAMAEWALHQKLDGHEKFAHSLFEGLQRTSKWYRWYLGYSPVNTVPVL